MEVKAKKIEMVSPKSLKQNPENNNRHSIEQLNRLEKIIKKQGFRVPIIVSTRSGFVVCGHARLDVALKLNMEKVPVIYQDFENEKMEYAHLTADNEIARWAELDRHLVYEKIKEFDDFNIDLLGIENFEPDTIKVDEIEVGSGEKGESFFLEVECVSISEMQELKENLSEQGYIVREK